jgi:hypothetical protein
MVGSLRQEASMAPFRSGSPEPVPGSRHGAVPPLPNPQAMAPTGEVPVT